MEIITGITDMHQRADAIRREGKTIAFVPTMGYFHDGHLELMRQAKKWGDIVVISIFVNPTQFGPGEDYERYPRDMERDLGMAREVGVDIVFNPSAQEMYPARYQTYVEVQQVTKNLCGASRPTHFRGVATVVAKLFNIVKPNVALFGQKDYQQLVTIQRMVADLNMDLEIVGVPTFRESDGLAMSSRNAYLTSSARREATSLYRSLQRAQTLTAQGVTETEQLIGEVRTIIASAPSIDIDYIKICDPVTLEDIDEIKDTAVLALAANAGKARLIDNIILKEGQSCEGSC